MNTKKTLHKSTTLIALALTVLLVSTLSCNLPSLPFLGEVGTPEENLEDSLQSSGVLFVEEIDLSQELVQITYQVFPEEDLELMAAGWLNALLAAYEVEPGAASYQLVTSRNGKPFLEITSRGLDLEGLVNEELSGEEFLDRLEVADLRPVDSRALILLEPLGLALDEVALSDGTLSISYWPEPAADQGALMDEWWSIFDTLQEMGDEVEAIEIQSKLTDGSVILVQGSSEGLADYLAGEITALQYLADLEVVVEPSNPD
jgi:hypothetical protein